MANKVQVRNILITADDGHTFDLRLFLGQDHDHLSPLILFIPAMAIPASKYERWCEELVSSGLDCAVFDLRGVGSSNVRASRQVDFSYATIIQNDIPAVHRALVNELGDRPLFFAGHSLGGQLALLYLATIQSTQSQPMPNGLILAASCSIYYRSWASPFSYGLLAFTQFARLLALLIGYFPGKRVGFGGREARSLIKDWALNARTGVYRSNDPTQFNAQIIDFEQKLAELSTLPVLCLNYELDTFAPKAASKHMLSKLKSSLIEYQTIMQAELQNVAADHYGWMKQPSTTVGRVVEWIERLT